MVFLNRKSEPRAQANTQASAPPIAPGLSAGDAALDRQPTLRHVAGTAAPAAGHAAGAIQAAEDVESVIGNDFSIEGQTITIRCKGSLRVNGNIQANLHSRRLVVGEAARITGAIVAEEVAVHGQVEGSISGAVVKLEPSAVVDGDIQAHKLAIDSGARFEGRSHWVDDPGQIAPQVEPPLQAGRLNDMAPANVPMPMNGISGMRAAPNTHEAMHGILTPPPGRIPN